MVYLTLGTLWKGEDTYAKDFIAYHKYVGVERFIVYDREFNKVSEMFKDDPSIIVKPYPDDAQHLHSHAWADLIAECQMAYPTEWLALIDADEALVPVKTDDMREVLKDYEQYASLQLNWHTHGSSNNETRTEGSLYERFTMRAEGNAGVNGHTQSIVQPMRCLAVQTADPHHVKMPPNEISVNTNKQRIVGPFNRPPLHDVAWIFHAYTKSRQEWREKNAKGRADIWGAKINFTLYDQYNEFCNEVQEPRVKELWERAK